MKRVISILLSVIIMLSLAVPAFASAEEYPTIYVTGAQTNTIYNAEGEVIYPLEQNIIEALKPTIVPCLEELALGMIDGDYEAYTKKVYQAVLPVFEDVMLDKNGEATDGSHPQHHSSTVSVSSKQSGYGMWDYRFWYDWRLSPVTSAEELKNYIDRVRDATGKDKVQLVGRCYGANVIQAYITLYEDHSLENVSDITYYSASVNGIDFMSAFFTGDLVLEEQAVVNFVEYYLEYEEILEDDALATLLYELLDLLKQVDVLGLGTDAAVMLVDEIKADLIPEILPVIVGSWPSYWSMVNPEDYNEAIDFVFADNREEYQGLIEKTDYYYYNVQLKIDETILKLQENGINFYFFTKYGFADMPLYEGATIEGDSYTGVPRQSFGAQAADYGEVFSKEYIDSLEDTTYLSPDYKINAATCLIPERSWFVKNLHHNEFAVLHDMTLEIMRYDMTVENESYPQFLEHLDGTVSPLETYDEDYTKAPENIGATGIRLITALIRFITNLIRNGFSFLTKGA